MKGQPVLKVIVSDERNILRAFRPRLVRLLRLAAPRAWEDAALSLAIVSGKEMAALNRRFTGRRGETDVLAFPLDDGPALSSKRDKAGPTMVGEIVVNASLAAREAEARGAAPAHELALYAVHGALHLAGCDDHDPQRSREMHRREEELLRRAGVPCVRQLPRIKAGPHGGRGARALPRKTTHA